MDGGKCQYIVFVFVVAFGAICIKLSLSADLQLLDNKYKLNDIVFWGCQRTTLMVNYTRLHILKTVVIITMYATSFQIHHLIKFAKLDLLSELLEPSASAALFPPSPLPLYVPIQIHFHQNYCMLSGSQSRYMYLYI